LYWNAFESFRNFKELKTFEDNLEFCDFMENMLKIHRKVIPLLVIGIHESKKYLGNEELNIFMNETFQSRLSRRVLAEQHLALTKDFKNPDKKTKFGIVDSNCRAIDSINNAIKSCDELFMDTYDCLPPVVTLDGKLNAQFTYIPGHVEYILTELLKNSMRFTFEHHGSQMPQIKVTIGYADDQVMFRVSDSGID
jgi:signal transduction histidine kinase